MRLHLCESMLKQPGRQNTVLLGLHHGHLSERFEHTPSAGGFQLHATRHSDWAALAVQSRRRLRKQGVCSLQAQDRRMKPTLSG